MSTNTNPEPSTTTPKAFDLTKFIPFATAGFIFLGVSRLIFYYGLFDISILSFLEFGEIITSFLDFIVINSLSVILLWVLIVEFEIITLKRTDGINLGYKSLTKKFYLSIVFLLIILIGLVVLIAFDDKKVFWLILTLTSISLLIGLFFYRIYKKYSSGLIKGLCLITTALITGETVTFFVSVGKFRAVMNKQLYIGTRIIFDKDAITDDSSHIFISDSTNFYIGKTNNYIFIHHKSKSLTSVYPLSSVKQIDIKRTVPKNWFRNLIE
jgi:hypothetical protein